MKVPLVVALFIGFCGTTLAQSQPNRRNLFSIGQTAGYFFDSTPVVMYRTNFPKKQHGYNIRLNYTRILNEQFALSFTGMYAQYRYYKLDTNFQKGKVPENLIVSRLIFRSAVHLEYMKPWGKTQFQVQLGPNFTKAHKVNHYRYSEFSSFDEPINEYVEMGKWGLSVGSTWTHPIIGRFFGAINFNYVRSFKATAPYSARSEPDALILDPNQLYISYSIGFRF